MSRYFTKSLHKKALECPTKLYYQSKSDEYDNNNLDNAFLLALAKGGFQVGELAKVYYPGGKEVESLRSAEAIKETMEYLKQDKALLYEAAVQHDEFLIRVDILEKDKDTIRLYEVKAKSFHPDEDSFYNRSLLKKNQFQLASNWKPYLYDIAFQTMVCQLAFPNHKIHSYMIFADKSKLTSVEGLNQRFLLSEVNGRTRVKIAPGTDAKAAGSPILCTISVDDVVDKILKGEDQGAKSRTQLGLPSFQAEAKEWAKAYLSGTKITPNLTKDCRDCEFRTHGDKKSGFDECWTPRIKSIPKKGQLVLDLWNFRKTNDLIQEGRLLLEAVTSDDLKVEESTSEGMSPGQRQWLQVQKHSSKDTKPEIEYSYLKHAISTWKFPLHCIDFETTMVAIPFHKNRRPYEQIAFQFSHHIIHHDGRVEHAGEFLHTEQGKFPNFDFLRALKAQLEKDQGSIFRYSNHENTVLCQILKQLEPSTESDKDELITFIKEITKGPKDNPWEGPRNMIDLWEIVKKAYYHPQTNGSNSIKKVLPAVLGESQYLKEKYSQNIYGHSQGIPSHNFKNQSWLKLNEDGQVIDPYKQLPPIFEGIDQELLDSFLSDDDELAEGGAAMMAFARMQFSEMSPLEMQKLRDALLRYCELDTLAMVMIIEHFFEITRMLSWKAAS